MHHKPRVYLGATDVQMEPFLDADAFSRALVHGVLFHGDQVIPDGFLYFSRRLFDFATTVPHGREYLEACVRNGAIIPAFRRDPQGSFRENLEEIRRMGIQGVLPQADDIAELFQQAIRGKRLHPIIWPTAPSSVGYKATLERSLLAESLPSGSPHLEQFWEETKAIRSAVIGSTRLDELGGFRRGDINNSLAAYLGLRNDVVHNVETIKAQVTDHQLATAAQRLLKWVNYCYHFNQGRMLTLNPGLPSLDPLDTEFATHLAQLQQSESDAYLFRQGFQFPSAEALLTVDPNYIFDIRDSETGATYFSALTAWQESPSEETANVLLERLEHYSTRLTAEYIEHGQSIPNWVWYLRAHVPAGRSRWQKLGIEAAGHVTMDVLGHLAPGIGLTSLVGKFAAAVYESLPIAPNRIVSREGLGKLLGIRERVRIEAETGVTRVGQERTTNLTTDASFE